MPGRHAGYSPLPVTYKCVVVRAPAVVSPSTPHLLQTFVAGCAVFGTGTAAVSASDSRAVVKLQTLQLLRRPVRFRLVCEKAAAGRVAWHRLHRISAGYAGRGAVILLWLLLIYLCI